MNYVIAVVVLIVVGYVWHCEDTKSKHTTFVANIRAEAKAQITKIEKDAKNDKANADRLDKENAGLRADSKRLARELRDARARTSFLPAPGPGTASPEKATILRAEFERTMAYLDDRGSGIIEEGDGYRVDLDTAKKWEAGRRKE